MKSSLFIHALRLRVASRRAASLLTSSTPSTLRARSTAASATLKPQSCTSPFLDIREDIREVILTHAGNVYKHPRTEFDPTRVHDTSVGAETAIIPLVSRPDCREMYCSPRNQCRFGMVLEDLDLLATWVGYKHNQDPSVPMGTPGHHTMGIVTARIDRVDVVPGAEFRADQDVVMHGYVSWMGTSSMELTIDVSQNDANLIPRHLMSSKFIMVAITPELKAAPNVALKLLSDEDRRLFEMGERAKELRVQRDSVAVSRVQPTSEELSLLRQLELKVLDPLSLANDYSRIPVGHVLMDGAKMENSVRCMPTETNCHGTVHGGFLLRAAYETAWCNAAVFADQPVKCTSATNGLYSRSVNVGDILYMSSQVCYTQDRAMQTLVTCQAHNPKTNKLETTNVFHFTFESETPVRSVLPSTYTDGLRYVHCRREYNYAMSKSALSTKMH